MATVENTKNFFFVCAIQEHQAWFLRIRLKCIYTFLFFQGWECSKEMKKKEGRQRETGNRRVSERRNGTRANLADPTAGWRRCSCRVAEPGGGYEDVSLELRSSEELLLAAPLPKVISLVGLHFVAHKEKGEISARFSSAPVLFPRKENSLPEKPTMLSLYFVFLLSS